MSWNVHTFSNILECSRIYYRAVPLCAITAAVIEASLPLVHTSAPLRCLQNLVLACSDSTAKLTCGKLLVRLAGRALAPRLNLVLHRGKFVAVDASVVTGDGLEGLEVLEVLAQHDQEEPTHTR